MTDEKGTTRSCPVCTKTFQVPTVDSSDLISCPHCGISVRPRLRPASFETPASPGAASLPPAESSEQVPPADELSSELISSHGDALPWLVVYSTVGVLGVGAATIYIWVTWLSVATTAYVCVGFMFGLLLWYGLRLRDVAFDGENIYVDSGPNKVTIPLSEIKNVARMRWMRGLPVTVSFEHETPVGKSIVFFSNSPWLYFLIPRDDSLSVELARRVAIARRRAEDGESVEQTTVNQ